MSEVIHEYRKKYPIIRLSVAKELSHGICVSNLAYHVAKELKMPEDECHKLAVAGLLHDIGKLELSRFVNGQERETLTIEEMKYVRWHAKLGAEILQKQGYPQDIVEMVCYHHENCDGSGYPRNLTREDIPFGARILRVCDVFAALTSDRPYRKSFDVETAMELMIEEAKNYDLQVFLAFMRVVHSDDLPEILEKQGTEEQLAYWTRGLEL
ncbi:MAG: HD domain-containing protein [Lachnospiraceae bacterium]|nr:HD domain-containing protein [Lachnospiraceae bacterium]